MKHSFKMPKHAKEHVDFDKKFFICCFRKSKDLRSINNAKTTYLHLNKKKEDYSNLIKTSGKIIHWITQTFLPCFAQFEAKPLVSEDLKILLQMVRKQTATSKQP